MQGDLRQVTATCATTYRNSANSRTATASLAGVVEELLDRIEYELAKIKDSPYGEDVTASPNARAWPSPAETRELRDNHAPP